MVSKKYAAAHAKLRKHALAMPEAYEEHPWGESVAKVNKKVFVFMGMPDKEDGTLGFSVKLVASQGQALDLDYTEPTGYGLGKSGWVTVRFPLKNGAPPWDIFFSWIDESYRAIAPKKLVKTLG